MGPAAVSLLGERHQPGNGREVDMKRNLVQSLGIVSMMGLFAALPLTAYADGPESLSAAGDNGVVRSQISNPELSGFPATGGGAGFVPVAGIAGSGIVTGRLFDPNASTGGGAGFVPVSGVAGSGVVRGQLLNEQLGNGGGDLSLAGATTGL